MSDKPPSIPDMLKASLFGAMEDALDCLPLGVIIVDANGEAVFMNDYASKIIADFASLSLSENRVVAETGDEKTALAELITALIQTEDKVQYNTFRAIALSRPHPMQPLYVVVKPLRRRQGTADGSVVVIFVNDPERDDEASYELLAQLCGFTSVESKLTIKLLHGKGVKWAAIQSNMSYDTARNHLKQILVKTQTHCQAELLRLVLSNPAILRMI